VERLAIQTHDTISDIAPEVWDHLVGDGSPFLEHAFLSTLEDTGCVGEGTGWFPAILTAHRRVDDRPGDLLGAVPFYIKTHSHGEFVFDWGWADAAMRAGIAYYPKAVAAVPLTPVTGVRLLVDPDVEDPATLRRALVSGAIEVAEQAGLSSVHFNFVDPDELTVFEEVGLPIRHGVQYHWYNGRARGEDGDYGDFDDFLSRFRSKKRSNIRRERRKLDEWGVRRTVLRGDEITAGHMRRMFRYYKDTVDKFYWGRQYLTREFFETIRLTLPDRLHLVVAEQDGEEFAGAFNLYKADRLYGRYWGCTRDVQFTHFDVCFYTAIDWCIAQDCEVFEPGAGGEHKFERGFQPTRTYSAHWVADPRLRQAVTAAIDDEKKAVSRRIEAMQADSPFKDVRARSR